MPHPTTLMKLTTRCGTAAIDGLNEALLAKAVEAKVLRTSRLRADTTVIPANVAYPTDSGLLARAVKRIAVTGQRTTPPAAPSGPRCGTGPARPGNRPTGSPRSWAMRSAQLRDEAQATVRRITGELADLATKAADDAEKLLVNAPRSLRTATAKANILKAAGVLDVAAGRRRGRLHRAVNDLTELLAATRQIAAQTRLRVAGQVPDGATRRFSLHESDARPIAKGRLGKPVEFDYKAQNTDTDDGVVVDHTVEQWNPPDAPQLAPAVKRVIARTGRKPRTVTADRGYGEQRVEDDLGDLGVRHVVIPRKGKPGNARQTVERRSAFRRTVKWRTGCEARISALKRGYGLDRSRIDGTEGAKIWVGHGILAHNLVKIAALTA